MFSPPSPNLVNTRLEPGRHDFVTAWKVAIGEGGFLTAKRWLGGAPRGSAQWRGTPMVEEVVEVNAVVDILPSHQPAIDLVEDASLEPLMQQAFKLTPHQCQAEERFDFERPGAVSTFVMGDILVGETPIDFAFDVLVRSNGKTWHLTRIDSESFKTRQEETGSNLIRITEPAPGFTGDSADIILRSSPAAAARTFGLERIWEGDIVFKDVEIQWRP